MRLWLRLCQLRAARKTFFKFFLKNPDSVFRCCPYRYDNMQSPKGKTKKRKRKKQKQQTEEGKTDDSISYNRRFMHRTRNWFCNLQSLFSLRSIRNNKAEGGKRNGNLHWNGSCS